MMWLFLEKLAQQGLAMRLGHKYSPQTPPAPRMRLSPYNTPICSFMFNGIATRQPWLVVLCLVLISIVVRCAVGFHPHSGESKPPMFGDYEAQRHWMELTVALPPKDWYALPRTLAFTPLPHTPAPAWHTCPTPCTYALACFSLCALLLCCTVL